MSTLSRKALTSARHIRRPGKLTKSATRCSARQVFDLPEPQPLIVTEHRAYRCRCGRCGGETRALFPEGVTAPVQYGPRLLAVYLLHYQLLPEWPRRWPTCSASGWWLRPLPG